MEIFGIDNVFFTVGDMNQAVDFYGKLGFPIKFRSDAVEVTVLSLGKEQPGLLLKRMDIPPVEAKPESARFWVEVKDVPALAEEFKRKGIPIVRDLFKLPTGWLLEVSDPWGNVTGFTDYAFQPEYGRSDKKG